jgi:hypothetical protein
MNNDLFTDDYKLLEPHAHHAITIKPTHLTGLVNIANILLHKFLMRLQRYPSFPQIAQLFHQLVLFSLLCRLGLVEVVVALLLLFLDEVFGVVLDVVVLDDVCVQDVLLVAWGLLGFDLGG